MSKLDRLRELLRSYGSCLVAYSGGVDSVFLAYAARQVLGQRMLAVIADSPSLPRRELEEALDLGRHFQIPVRVVQTTEFDQPEYLANPINRCYFCKHELFEQLVSLAKSEGLAVIVYGENASDIGDHRPGVVAAAEFQVRAPLKEVGLTKGEIRELSAQFGLPTAEKPQMACLSSRIPYGEAVSPEKLAMIESAENVLRDMGFHDVRVRHHELGRASVEALKGPSVEAATASAHRADASTLQPFNLSTHSSFLARIEVGVPEMPKFLELRERVLAEFRRIGYSHVTLDLQGYRRGSANEAVKAAGSAVADGTRAEHA